MKRRDFLGALSSLPLVALPGPAYAAIAVGVRVIVTVETGARTQPFLAAPQIGNKLVGSQGLVIGGPVPADGHIWWNVDFDIEPSGWVRETRIAEITTAPPPPPPPPANLPLAARIALNMTRVLCLNVQFTGIWAPYDRWVNHVCLTQANFAFPFSVKSLAAGGALIPFAYSEYRLRINGIERATALVAANATKSTFTGGLGTEPDGPAFCELVPYANGAPVSNSIECAVPFWIWIDRTGQARNHPDVFIQTGSHSWTRESYGVHAYMRLPKASLHPRVLPQVARLGTPFTVYLPPAQITRRMLVPTVEANTMQTYRPVTTSRSITVTENLQGYFERDMFDPYPRLPQLDGERGDGTCYYPLHIKAGRGGKWYFASPWAIRRIEATGKITTLAGLRHKFAPYFGDTSLLDYASEIVGNWDAAIPMLRRIIWECWGFDWDTRTLALNAAAAPIGGEQPHLPPGPVMFAVDRFGRCLRLQFNGSNRSAPPYITEFITGLNDPFSVVFDPAVNQLYISERGAHRISRWSANAPQAYLGNVIADPSAFQYGYTFNPPQAFATAQPRRFQWYAGSSAGIAAARAATICAPEALFLQDGFLYWGALAQAEVRRINLATAQVQVCCRPSTSFSGVGPYFVNLALSDGTFGPRGTLFTVTFYNAEYGRPQAFKPIAGSGLTHSQLWNWQQFGRDVIQGPGGTWPNDVYPTACAVGNGMLACGSSLDAFNVYMQRDASDGPNIDYTRATRGHDYWKSRSYDLAFGKYGYGWGASPPRGENADCDYWLTVNGR